MINSYLKWQPFSSKLIQVAALQLSNWGGFNPVLKLLVSSIHEFLFDMNYQQEFDQRSFFFSPCVSLFVKGTGIRATRKLLQFNPTSTNCSHCSGICNTHTKWNEGSKYPISSLGKLRYESIHSTDDFREVSLVAQWKAAGNKLD